MNNSPVHPMAEAKVQIRIAKGDWVDSMDLDPMEIPVEIEMGGQPVGTDVFSDRVMALVDGIVEAEAGFSEHRTETMTQYRLVWSVTGESVLGTCPGCDKGFPVSEGIPGDELNEGYNAVCCGCERNRN